MKKFAAYLLCALMVLTMAAPAIAAVPDADAKLIESLGKKASDYVALDWFAEMNAYYNSDSATLGNVVTSKANSTATNLANFIVSKTFTQKELPIGSIIIVDAGYQYRPEGWVKADLSKDDVTRPGNVTTNVVEVTKEWWGTFTVRAFNLSTTPTRAVVEGDKAALRIYVPASAAEDNVYTNDFEAVPVGAVGKLDGSSVNCVKKEGVIEVVKFDGDNALRVDHKDTGNKHDPYVNFVENSKGISSYGCGKQVVLEYDVYFESSCKDMSFMVGTARVATDAGNKFQTSATIKGEDLAVIVSGETEPAMNLKLKTWYKLATCYDLEKKVVSVYVDGVCIGKDLPFTAEIAAASGEINLIRTCFQSWATGTAALYLDNVKVYNATQPRVVKQAAPTVAVPETKAPVSGGTTAAPTADIAVVLAAVSAVAASGAIVFKKKR